MGPEAPDGQLAFELSRMLTCLTSSCSPRLWARPAPSSWRDRRRRRRESRAYPHAIAETVSELLRARCCTVEAAPHQVVPLSGYASQGLEERTVPVVGLVETDDRGREPATSATTTAATISAARRRRLWRRTTAQRTASRSCQPAGAGGSRVGADAREQLLVRCALGGFLGWPRRLAVEHAVDQLVVVARNLRIQALKTHAGGGTNKESTEHPVGDELLIAADQNPAGGAPRPTELSNSTGRQPCRDMRHPHEVHAIDRWLRYGTMEKGDKHIEHIRNALWSPPGRPGASIMVGAGLSLNAVKLRSDAPPFLTWAQLATKLEGALGYATPSGRGTSDALRLASEFESAHGPNRLEALIREAVPEEFHRPGPLHEMLVSLPWVDIFTTNYDQLLEWAARALPDHRFSEIRTIRDIPTSARPRIVKLHGSFPGDRPFILTEEHYRTYPVEFAPFVNLVRQAVMESVLCLVGFSGDDPNFLQWAGWVRDNLGASAPPIYLCGVLDLSGPREHLLRSRGIIPIDLASRFCHSEHPIAGVRHAKALEWFLRVLLDGQPFDDSDWPTLPPEFHVHDSGLPPLLAASRPRRETRARIADDRHKTSENVNMIVSSWHATRTWYPGWVCMPDGNHRQLWREVKRWYSDPELAHWIATTKAMPAPQAVLAWYEFSWRLEKALCPPAAEMLDAIALTLEKVNPFPALISDMPGAITPNASITATAEWIQAEAPELTWERVANCWIDLVFAVMRCAREDFASSVHERWMRRTAPLRHLTPEYSDRYFHEKSMMHLFRLEQEALVETLSQWKPDPQRAVSQVKHATLLAESGDSERALEELHAALAALRGARASRRRQTSSEEACILWMIDLLDNVLERHIYQRRWYERQQRLAQLSAEGGDLRSIFRTLSERLREMRLSEIHARRDQEAFDPGYQNAALLAFG